MATTKATTLAHTLGGISSDISTAEINRLDGVTGDLQTQLDAKAPKASPAFTGNTTIPDGGTIGSASDTDAITISSTGKVTTADSELNVKTTSHTFTVKGIDSAIGDSQSGTAPDTTDSDSGQFAVYNGSTKMFGITEHGYVLKPNQPAFRAENTGDVSNWTTNITLSTQGTWSSPVNRGNNFNTTNGRYTAPVTGAYMISYGISMSSSNNSTGDGWSAIIYLNGSAYFDQEINYEMGSVSGEERHSGNTLVMQLNAGDYIQVGTAGLNGSTNFVLVYATLSGHLIG